MGRLLKLVPGPLLQYADFSGRLSRSRYWRWVLFLIVVFYCALSIDSAWIAPAMGFLPYEAGAPNYATWAVALLLVIPILAAAIRRLHDCNRSGWWMLLGIPVIVALYYLQDIFLIFYTRFPELAQKPYAFSIASLVPYAPLLPVLYWHLRKGSADPNRFGVRP